MGMTKVRAIKWECDACGEVYYQAISDGEPPQGYSGKVDLIDDSGGVFGVEWFADSKKCIPEAIEVAIERERSGLQALVGAVKKSAKKTEPTKFRGAELCMGSHIKVEHDPDDDDPICPWCHHPIPVRGDNKLFRHNIEGTYWAS